MGHDPVPKKGSALGYQRDRQAEQDLEATSDKSSASTEAQSKRNDSQENIDEVSKQSVEPVVSGSFARKT